MCVAKIRADIVGAIIRVKMAAMCWYSSYEMVQYQKCL